MLAQHLWNHRRARRGINKDEDRPADFFSGGNNPQPTPFLLPQKQAIVFPLKVFRLRHRLGRRAAALLSAGGRRWRWWQPAAQKAAATNPAQPLLAVHLSPSAPSSALLHRHLHRHPLGSAASPRSAAEAAAASSSAPPPPSALWVGSAAAAAAAEEAFALLSASARSTDVPPPLTPLPPSPLSCCCAAAGGSLNGASSGGVCPRSALSWCLCCAVSLPTTCTDARYSGSDGGSSRTGSKMSGRETTPTTTPRASTTGSRWICEEAEAAKELAYSSDHPLS